MTSLAKVYEQYTTHLARQQGFSPQTSIMRATMKTADQYSLSYRQASEFIRMGKTMPMSARLKKTMLNEYNRWYHRQVAKGSLRGLARYTAVQKVAEFYDVTPEEVSAAVTDAENNE